MDAPHPSEPRPAAPAKPSFGDDFKRFFVRGLATVLPTLITIVLIVKMWELLSEYLGKHIMWVLVLIAGRFHPERTIGYYRWKYGPWAIEAVGVLLAIVLMYIVGLFVGHFIGRTAWRLVEVGVMRLPFVRAIYPAVKQVTDFILTDRQTQFQESRVVAVEPHASGIWSIGLVTGHGVRSLEQSVGTEMLTVFIPSSPTAFSGYVVVVPRSKVVELPMTVEEVMRLLITGGVSPPTSAQASALPGRAEQANGGGTLPLPPGCATPPASR